MLAKHRATLALETRGNTPGTKRAKHSSELRDVSHTHYAQPRHGSSALFPFFFLSPNPPPRGFLAHSRPTTQRHTRARPLLASSRALTTASQRASVLTALTTLCSFICLYIFFARQFMIVQCEDLYEPISCLLPEVAASPAPHCTYPIFGQNIARTRARVRFLLASRILSFLFFLFSPCPAGLLALLQRRSVSWLDYPEMSLVKF